MLKISDKLPNMHSTKVRGIPVVIQWPAGSVRTGQHKDGTPFKTEMKCSYGYFPDTISAGDEERLDVYIGPDENAENAYVIEQIRKDTGEFDEYKVMLNFGSLEDAEDMYEYNIGKDADVEMNDISEVPFDYLFDRVVEERREDQEQEREEIHTEIENDKQKVGADFEHDEKMSVIEAFIKLYKKEQDFYGEVAHRVAESLEDALTEAGVRALVTYRAKKPRKLKAKLYVRDKKRHYQSFRDIYEDIVDLAGVRVALYLPADREAVGQIIEKIFAPVRTPKQFPRDREPGSNDSLGYVATHYLVQLRPETLHKDELRYADTNVEIQVASVLMHAWAEVAHDLIYKPEKGALIPEEMRMIKDLNDIVQAGEAKLEQLQESVEARNNGAELRFELAAALTKLAKRLELQSKGRAKSRIGAMDIAKVARQAALISGKIEAAVPSIHGSYLRAKLALWKAHKADELDDRLREAYEKAQYKRPEGAEDHFIAEALKKLHPRASNVSELTNEQYQKVLALAQDLKSQDRNIPDPRHDEGDDFNPLRK